MSNVEDIDPDLMKDFHRRNDLIKWEDTARVLSKVSTRMLALLAWIVVGGFIFGGLPLTLDTALVAAVLTAISAVTFFASRVIMRKAEAERNRELQERSRRLQFFSDAYISAVSRALNLNYHRRAA